jgi:hypothetical protein
MICPHCHRTIHEQRRYLMSVDPDKPGLPGCLRGDAGEAWRVFVTIAVCVLAVLVITALSLIVRQIGPGGGVVTSAPLGSNWFG